MNTPQSRSGVALVIVLLCLVMLSALAISLFLGGRNETVSSGQNAALVESTALSELAVTLVQGQIRDATLHGPRVNAWASQPGAIRVWDNEGKLEKLYKLYSSREMQTGSLEFLDPESEKDDLPANWSARPSEFTDLNEPVAIRMGTGDARRWVYPILNPAAIGEVEGFSSTLADQTDTNWDDRAAMPVRWLYVLKDGSIRDQSAATADNPMVGRIAFWTDDESCKVNINTASGTKYSPAIINAGASAGYAANEDSFWDVPATFVRQDYNYGGAPPAEGEYQRSSAHPASVNLLEILKGATMKQIFDLTPRYKWGGSENGTLSSSNKRTSIAGNDAKRERLYASVDELQFSLLRKDGDREKNTLPVTSGATSQEMLDRWRFFLTAQSRSPDLNLFGQPRVALWPVSGQDDQDHRTVYDQLIARCSTLGAMDDLKRKEYFFQRLYPLSQTDDWDKFPRNQKIFSYLRDLTGSPIPGFGSNFREKYDVQEGGVSGEWDQILTEMFDYIRCVNLNESCKDIGSSFKSYTQNINAPTVASEIPNFLNSKTYPGAGFVVPISIPDYGTRGAGRIPTLSEVAVVMIQRSAPPLPSAPSTPVVSGTIQTGLFFETFTPMAGFMPWSATKFNLRVTSTAKINGADIFPGQSSGVMAFTGTGFEGGPMNNGAAGSSIGSADGFSWLLPKVSTDNPLKFNYSFCRLANNGIAAPSSTVALSQGEVSVELSVGGTPYQTIHVELPAANLPTPLPWISAGAANAYAYDWAWRRKNPPSSGYVIYPEDVVHSMVMRDGDYRIAAYLPVVPKGFFRPHRDFGQAGFHFAHSLRRKTHITARGSTFGKFVNVDYGKGDTLSNADLADPLATPKSYEPKIDPRITDLRAEGWEGDWDTGVSFYADGAYLNKPDDGFLNPRLAGRPYFKDTEWDRASGYFSPIRQMPSAAMFGSLPTGVKRTYAAYETDKWNEGRPWRTLLFCPNPAAGASHYGAQNPSDYLLLDFFNTPVVEPYAISEPFSTAGRINLNSQLLPFVYITRETGLHAVLSSQRVAAISNAAAPYYKDSAAQSKTDRIRFAINIEETLKQFKDRFAPNGKPEKGDLFKSAAEICSLFLIPNVGGSSSPTVANIASWWDGYQLTGDNLRERPYATTYPHLTTKSNVYTVHIRAQALKKVKGTPHDEFVENKDVVTSEYRGSATFERYIDPNDSRLTEMDPDKESLEPLYRYRIVETKKFAP